MIDEHIAKTIAEGTMISEVSVFFGTPEQQRQLAEMYDRREMQTAVPVY